MWQFYRYYLLESVEGSIISRAGKRGCKMVPEGKQVCLSDGCEWVMAVIIETN
jgi:hypothetical protein